MVQLRGQGGKKGERERKHVLERKDLGTKNNYFRGERDFVGLLS